MSTPATTIAECITLAPNYIAVLTYEQSHSLKTQFGLWTVGLFGAAGVFPPANPGSQEHRNVVNWYAQHIIADGEIEGPAIGDGGPTGVSAVINAVTRVLYAIDDNASVAQKAAVVALFNATLAVGPEPEQSLGAWGSGGADEFIVDDSGVPTNWEEYSIVLTNPPQPAGEGWTLQVTVANPPTANVIEARVGEVADAAGVWAPVANAVGIFIDSLAAYPTLAQIAAELLTVDVEVLDFGNVDSTDLIDGAAMIVQASVVVGVFELVPP